MMSAREKLEASIQHWIYPSHIVTERSTQQEKFKRVEADPDSSIVFNFMNTEWGQSSVVITFESELLEAVQHAISTADENLLEKYMNLIKEFITIYATGHAHNGGPHWILTTEIFQPPRLEWDEK